MKNVDQRKGKRFKIKGGIALTPNGVCQVINISKGGLSLKCFKEVAFPHEWTMDIYDETDLNLQELKVKKVWEKILSVQGAHADSQVEAGVAFKNSSSSLEAQLQVHLLQLMEVKKNI